jgi:hypothetical protein
VKRRDRWAAWGLILALATFQAYAQRFAISPDGISYLDLSDAVVSGHWSGIVNLYWSPLYPLLVGLARAVSGAGPRGEVGAMHAVNLFCFAGLCAAFEYFYIQILAMARSVRGGLFASRAGGLAGYALFGFIALTMTPLELTTPDLLSNAAILLALGALLRLHDRASAQSGESDARERRAAAVLGVALGVGALAKAFLVPWALVCFVVLAVARRGRGMKPLVVAVGLFAVFVLPWSALLSARAGRPTFGDAGRLTYAWYVNSQDPPSLHVVPPGARRLQTDELLPGVGVTGDAPGTDPMWFDPVRWNAGIAPHFSLRDQIATLTTMTVTLFGSLSVLTFLALVVAVAPRGSRRLAWRRAWIVLLPCAAGILGYCAVILTARYIMAFVVGGIFVTLATVPIARRIRPMPLAVGLLLAVGVLAVSRVTSGGFSLGAAVLAAMLAGAIVPTRRHITWMVIVPVALVVAMILFPGNDPMLRYAALGFAVSLTILSRVAVRRGTPRAFAQGTLLAMALALSLLFAGRLVTRTVRDANAFEAAASPSRGNAEWLIAEDLRAHGVLPGAKIAVIGPHAESYWARTARVKIVANVPDPLVPVWWQITSGARDSIIAQFARAGAQAVILTETNPAQVLDARWIPLRYKGWMLPVVRR